MHTAQTCIREDIRQVFETLSECTSVCTNAPVLPEVASHPPPSMAEADTDLDDNIVAREERAAVLEYDGGLDRQQAEQEAAEEFSYPELPEFLIRQKQG